MSSVQRPSAFSARRLAFLLDSDPIGVAHGSLGRRRGAAPGTALPPGVLGVTSLGCAARQRAGL
jgi:hypothetical protein